MTNLFQNLLFQFYPAYQRWRKHLYLNVFLAKLRGTYKERKKYCRRCRQIFIKNQKQSLLIISFLSPINTIPKGFNLLHFSSSVELIESYYQGMTIYFFIGFIKVFTNANNSSNSTPIKSANRLISFNVKLPGEMDFSFNVVNPIPNCLAIHETATTS